MLLMDQSFSLTEIAHAAGMTPKRLRYWVDDSARTGVDFLNDANRAVGKHRRLSFFDGLAVAFTARFAERGIQTSDAWPVVIDFLLEKMPCKSNPTVFRAQWALKTKLVLGYEEDGAFVIDEASGLGAPKTAHEFPMIVRSKRTVAVFHFDSVFEDLCNGLDLKE